MELRHIRTFLAVAEELHFGRAADRLDMAQPAVSQHIRSLEKELGASLFDRSRRNVTLTQKGAALVEPAQAMLAAERLAKRAVETGATQMIGTVSLGFGGVSNHLAMPSLARAVRAELPGVELQLHNHAYASHAALAVARGDLDIAFSRLPAPTTAVTHRIYAYETPVVVLPADHPLAELEVVEMAQLSEENFVAYPGNVGSAMRAKLVALTTEAGFAPHIVQDAPDVLSILGLVAAGVGVTVHLDSAQDIQFPGVVFRPLSPAPAPTVATLCWREDRLNPAVQAVLTIAERVLPTPPEPV